MSRHTYVVSSCYFAFLAEQFSPLTQPYIGFIALEHLFFMMDCSETTKEKVVATIDI